MLMFEWRAKEVFTLETLVISELLHQLKVFPDVEGLEPAWTKHEVSDTIYSVTVEKYLR